MCLSIYTDGEVCLRFEWDSAERNALCFYVDGDRDRILRAKNIASEVIELMGMLIKYLDCLLEGRPREKCEEILNRD